MDNVNVIHSVPRLVLRQNRVWDAIGDGRLFGRQWAANILLWCGMESLHKEEAGNVVLRRGLGTIETMPIRPGLNDTSRNPRL